MGPAFVEGLPVEKFHGVGPATAAKMNRLGIKTGFVMFPRSRRLFPRSKSILVKLKSLLRWAMSASAIRHRLLRAQHLSLRAPELGFDFRRGDRADDLSRRDLVAFIHGQRREPAGVFRRDVDLRRFDTSVRFHDPIGHGGYRAAVDQRDQAQFAIKSAEADVQRLEAVLVDLVLVSPRSGRVQYRLARAGEVVAPGQRILTILDLNDVYMTIYLPATDAGKLAIGDEARIIADPIPEYVIPATISFVATDAQFTPKSVETEEERQKLMFRVKLKVDPKVLEKYHRQVKTGIRGLGFVRTSPSISWPDDLVVRLPQ